MGDWTRGLLLYGIMLQPTGQPGQDLVGYVFKEPDGDF